MSAFCPIVSHSFPFQLFTTCYTTPVSYSMTTETAHDLPIADKPTATVAQSDSRAESAALATSSSPTLAATKMVDRRVPKMSNFFKKTTVTEEERLAYHRIGWLTGNLISMIPEVDVPTVHGSTIVCFESYLIARLSLLTSTFLSSIMNFLSCELVQFNPNAIAALSCFAMLCECWLGIALDTSLFWYFYSPVRYTKVIYSGIELSLCHHHSQQIWMPPSRAPGRTLRRSDFSGYACSAVVGEQASVPPLPPSSKTNGANCR
jgi:hypothetical protein